MVSFPDNNQRSSHRPTRLRRRGRLVVLVCWLLTCAVPAVFSQDSDGSRIPIAVLNLRSTGGLSADEVGTINAYLQGRIAELPNFRVVEQAQLIELMEVFEQQQLTGMFDVTDVSRFSAVGAQQVIIGSVGKLFDQVTVSVRLVEIVTAEVAFSFTVHTPERELFSRLDQIVQQVNDYGMLTFRTISLDDVEQLVRRRRYAEAQDRIEQFFRQERRHGRLVQPSPRLAELQRRINKNLYRDYLRRSRIARRRRDYEEARRLINRAIALQPTSAAMEERDRILTEQAADERRRETQRRLAEIRAAEEQEQELAGAYLRPLDSIRFYFQQIEYSALRLSYAQSLRIDSDLSVPDEPFGASALQYYQTFSIIPQSEPDMVSARSVAGVTFAMTYNDEGSDATIDVHAAVAPHTAVAAKFFNVVLTLGLDGGILLRHGPGADAGATAHPTVGTSLTADLMMRGSFGTHAGVRLDHAFGSETDTLSPWWLRFFAGVSM